MLSARAFIKNTLYYFVPFLVMAILTVFFMNYAFQMLTDQKNEIISDQLQRGIDEIEVELFESQQLALEIRLDSTLSKEDILDYKLPTIRGMEKLFGYKQRSDMLSKVFIVNSEGEVITESDTCRLKTFYEQTLAANKQSIEQIEKLITDKISGSCVLESKSGTRHILLLYYYPGNHQVSERWIGFLISEDSLQERLQSVLGNVDSYLVLMYNGQVLLEIDQLSSDLTENENDLLYEALNTGEMTIEECTLLICTGSTYDIALNVVLNNSVMYEEISQQLVKIVVVIIAVFVFLSCFLWIFSKNQYKKARAVQVLAVNMYPEIAQHKRQGEYEFIRRVLERDFERLESNEQQIADFRKESKKQLSWLILKSTLPEGIELNKLMEQCGMNNTAKYYTVMNFGLFQEGEALDFLDEISEVLTYYGEKTINGIVLMIILSLNTRDESHEVRLRFSKIIIQHLADAGYVCNGVTCGLVYDGLAEIHSSQEEAFSLFSLLWEEKNTENVPLVFFDESTSMAKRIPHIIADRLQLFKQYLQEEKIEAAIELLSTSLLSSTEVVKDQLVYIRYKVVQIMLEIWKKRGISQEIFDDMLKMLDLEETDFLEAVKNYIVLLETREEANIVDAEQILEYVRKNALDSEISLISIADYFNISERSVRRIIKYKMNKTYKEFIIEIRLNKACELLIDSKMDVRDIAQQVGYNNAASFYGLFKRTYGMSPGEYRVLNGKGEQNA